jgi:hypothetical protein
MSALSLTPRNQDPAELWFLTDGISCEGPLPYETVARRAAEGLVSDTTLVRHESWNIWQRFEVVYRLGADGRAEMIRNLSTLSANLDDGSGPYSVPPPPPSSEELSRPARESGPIPRSSLRPAAVDPVRVLANTTRFSDAILLTLSTAVTAASAEVGLVHRHHEDNQHTITVGVLGPNSEALLGERLDDDDPTVEAAYAGHTVVVEPYPGDAGRFILGRIGRCIREPRGAAMVPLMLYGRLIALFEVGRRGLPLRGRDIARVEDVVEALAERAVVTGWLDR